MPGAVGALVAGASGSSIAGGIASGVAGLALNNQSRGRTQTIGGNTIPLFDAGGIWNSFDKNNGRLLLNTTPERQGLINSISQNYLDNANTIQSSFLPQYQNVLNTGIQSLNDQLGLVKPGYGALTDATVQAILNQGQQRTSDLRSSLAKRRVLGSSFGDNALNQQSLDTAQQVATAKATAFLQELDTSNKLITQKYNMQTQGLNDLNKMTDEIFSLKNSSSQAQLDEMNKLANLAQGLITGAMQQDQANARLEAQMAQQSAAARADSLSRSISNLDSSVTSGINNYFAG